MQELVPADLIVVVQLERGHFDQVVEFLVEFGYGCHVGFHGALVREVGGDFLV